MVKFSKLLFLLTAAFLISCGGKEEKVENQIKIGKKTTTTQKEKTTAVASGIPASKKVDLINKGIGPVKNLDLAAAVDQTMVVSGKELFKVKCMACHKTHKKFIGPAPVDILERRTPEWIMNMILNPEKMVAEDPLAKELLTEHNGSPMANQSLTEKEARAILEYFRTLKKE